MKNELRPDRLSTAPPDDLRVRTFDGTDGRRYAALWFSRPARSGPTLTSVEREVVEMILAGRSNAEIAAARHVALSTVATQVRRVFAKFGVSSRAELMGCLTD
jgi:DNA-binding CsgD family transcriptional regulator